VTDEAEHGQSLNPTAGFVESERDVLSAHSVERDLLANLALAEAL
jgi:hypothetical protein